MFVDFFRCRCYKDRAAPRRIPLLRESMCVSIDIALAARLWFSALMQRLDFVNMQFRNLLRLFLSFVLSLRFGFSQVSLNHILLDFFNVHFSLCLLSVRLSLFVISSILRLMHVKKDFQIFPRLSLFVLLFVLFILTSNLDLCINIYFFISILKQRNMRLNYYYLTTFIVDKLYLCFTWGDNVNRYPKRFSIRFSNYRELCKCWLKISLAISSLFLDKRRRFGTAGLPEDDFRK